MLKRLLVLGFVVAVMAGGAACKKGDKGGKKAPKVNCTADCEKMHKTCGAEMMKRRIHLNKEYKEGTPAKKAEILKKAVQAYASLYDNCIQGCKEEGQSPIRSQCAKIKDCTKFAKCAMGDD